MNEPTRELSKFEHWAVDAKYRKQIISSYRNNPFIEALPPIMSADKVIDTLGYYPPYIPTERFLPDHIRLHQIQSSLKFFHTLPEHLNLEARFSCIIRQGYVGRNPISPDFFRNIRQRVEFMRQTHTFERIYNPATTATGCAILGLPGTGKSASITAILAQYYQMIRHTSYKKRTFNRQHIVWLIIQTPHDGTIGGLCRNFFAALDNLMGTSYLKKYGRPGRDTKNEMIADMANLASLYGIGVLVFDELQNLSAAKSGGADIMLQFFVQLVNEIGIPIVFIGTDEARPFLTKALHKIRRLEGQGDVIWSRLEEGAVWASFVDALWTYQYTKQEIPLTTELRHVLYDESQGIIDFAVKLYMLAQTEAILTETDTITEQTIRTVAKQRLRLAQPVLAAIRSRDEQALRKLNVKDALTLDLEQYWEEARQRLYEKKPQAAEQVTSEPSEIPKAQAASTTQSPSDSAVKQPKPRSRTKADKPKPSTMTDHADTTRMATNPDTPKANMTSTPHLYIAPTDEFLSSSELE